MNPLTSKKLMQDAFKSIAETVLVNEQPLQAYITNAHLGMASRRHMHSLQPFQGDYVSFGEGVYMVVEDVINARGAKYKSTIQYCNYSITTPEQQGNRVIVDYDERGRPVYDYEIIPGREIHAILDMDRVTISGSQIRINTSVMMMLIPDTEENREEIQVNGQFDVYGTVMRVAAINRLKKGLMEVTLEVG